jgi:hypothetical protein
MTGRNRPAEAPPKVSARRAQRLQAREQQRKRDVQKRYVQMGIIAAVAVLAVVGIALFAVNRAQAQPGRAVANQGQQHIEKGQAHVAYNSRPPTSGPHWNLGGEAPVSWGIYEAQIPDEGQIHNLEHGGIMIQYSCRDGCPDLVKQLTDWYNAWVPTHPLPIFRNSSKIVIAPYADLPKRITLTAWNRIDEFDAFDQERIEKFVEAWRDKCCEAVP